MNASARATRYLLLSATVGLAAVLLIFALRTYRELAEMQRIYLHDRASILADQLETLSTEQLERPVEILLRRHEPGIITVRLYRVARSDDPAPVVAIREGRELSRTEEVNADGRKVFRAWMPFHSAQQLHIACIDLELTGADFLLAHARRNLLVASLSGMTLLMLALWTVISARRAADLEKRHLQMEHLAHLGQMSAVMAHEIRNPLGTIKGFAQLACEKGDQRIGSLLAPVLTEIARLEKLVKDLLLYSKPCQAASHRFDWGDFAAGLRPFVAEAIGPRPIGFECGGDSFDIETDPDLLKELLLNLLRNAVEALAPAGAGTVRLRATAGPPLWIAVEDNGPGMGETVRSHLFEPFYTTKASGTGLGLSVARKLAQALGADLEFRAIEPHGTRAELRFGSDGAPASAGRLTHGTHSDH